MNVNMKELREQYASLTDEALLEINRDELTDVARVCFDAELAERGLKIEAPEPAESEAGRPQEELIEIAEFQGMEEGNMASGLLQTYEIPSRLQCDPLTGTRCRVLVPASLVEQAREILDNPLSDDDLAAQAEAAAAEFEDQNTEE